MLDFVKRVEEPRRSLPFDTPMKCDVCHQDFMGQKWMIKQKNKLITCRNCWKRTEYNENI